MNKPLPIHRQVVAGRQRMTPSEAFVETLVAQGVTDVFGIVGSAYMDASAPRTWTRSTCFPRPASAS